MMISPPQRYIAALRLCNKIIQHLTQCSHSAFESNYIELLKLEKAWSLKLYVKVLSLDEDNEKLFDDIESRKLSMEDLFPSVPKIIISKQFKQYSPSQLSSDTEEENQKNEDESLNCLVYDSDPAENKEIVVSNTNLTEESENNFKLEENISDSCNLQLYSIENQASLATNQVAPIKSITTRPSLESVKQFLQYQNSLKYKCPTCDKILTTQRWYVKHSSVCAGKKLLCSICGGHFLRKYYKLHLKRHSKLKDHKCTACGKGFVDRCGLKQHLISHGVTNNRVLCTTCGKTFKHYTEFYRHNYEVHLGRRYKCETCGKEFARNHSLNLHKLRHDDKRNFRCGGCDKAFKTKDCLQRHMITHRSLLPFACNMCAKTFSQKHNLKVHLKTHGLTLSMVDGQGREGCYPPPGSATMLL